MTPTFFNWSRPSVRIIHASEGESSIGCYRMNSWKGPGRRCGIKMGRDSFFELLAANKLLIRRRRRLVRTTFSAHGFRKYPNLIKELVVESPNQLLVADITYWFTQFGCLYISLVTDDYSKRIMGHCVAPSLDTDHCKTALQIALNKVKKREAKSLIHHSDRGIQYCSKSYIALLDAYNVQISMTQTGDPLDNPVAERVNGHRGAVFLKKSIWLIERFTR